MVYMYITIYSFMIHTLSTDQLINHRPHPHPGLPNQNLLATGLSDVATASVHSEKTWVKKWIMIIIIMITEKTFTSK